MSSIILDLLLLLIFAMMVPLGFFRGGLREVCTVSGVLFGILLASEWGIRLGRGLRRVFDMEEGSSIFLASILIVVLSTAMLGYGASAAFSMKPGPGGRMYGAFLALLSAVIVTGYLINRYIDTIHDGTTPATVANAWIARALSAGFHWVLLAAAAGVLVATLFGLFVRERDSEPGYGYQPPPTDFYHIPRKEREVEVRPLEVEETVVKDKGPVRIREVRHWEDDQEPERPSPTRYGQGWRTTWPGDATEQALPWDGQTPPRRAARPERPAANPSTNRKETLSAWVKNQSESGDRSKDD